MAYSVLQMTASQTGDYFLYCSEQKKSILTGTQDEMYDLKHCIEEMEQMEDNRQYLNNLKKQRQALLKNAVHSHLFFVT